jgi:hypothetical protein
MELNLLVLLLLQVHVVFSNTEKTIFLGPSQVQVPVAHPTLEDLRLEALSPQDWSLRTHIRAEFPTSASKYGQASWYLLYGLREGQRYEVRICWAATVRLTLDTSKVTNRVQQPTSFHLDTYDLQNVFDTPELITSLAQYSETRQPDPTEVEDRKASITKETEKFKVMHDEASSTLFLQVFTAADYYTTNQTLMDHVPPVFVDIILDPYIFNVFPRSLLPTAAYITILAIGSWSLSKYISKWFQKLPQYDIGLEKKVS